MPVRSNGSLPMNRELMPVELEQVTPYPLITGRTRTDPIFQSAADLDLQLVENGTLDRHTPKLTHRPTPLW
jgi:hypothetical protein